MAGTGNLLLKRGNIMPYNTTQDDGINNTTKILLSGMPAAQIVGLSPYYDTAGSTESTATSQNAKYIGTSTIDYPNRLWLGTNAYATTDSENTDDSGTVRPYTSTGATTYASNGQTRPLWVGAEIRASEPVTEDGTAITFTGTISTATVGNNLSITAGSISGGTLATGMRIEVYNASTGAILPILAEGTHLFSGSGNSWTVLPRPTITVQGSGGAALSFKAYKNPYVVLKANWDRPSDYVLVTQKAISTMPLRVWEEKGDPMFGTSAGVKEWLDFNAWDGTGGTPPSTIPSNNKISTNTILYFPDGTGHSTPTTGNNTILVANLAQAASGTDPAKIYLSWSSTAAALQEYTSATNGSNFALLSSDGATKGKQTFLSPIGVENYLDLTAYTVDSVTYPATISCSVGTAASVFDTTITDLSIGGATELIEIGNGSTGGSTATTIYGELTVTGPTNLSTDTVIDGGTY